MATDASMDQPDTPPTFPEEAMDAITAKLREVEAALLARARQFGVSFYYQPPNPLARPMGDPSDPIEVYVDPAQGMVLRHHGTPTWFPLIGASTQLRLAAVDASQGFAAAAVRFYSRLATLRAAKCTSVLNGALALLAAPAQADMRGANMPRD